MPYSSRNVQGSNLGPGDYRAANPSLNADDKSVALLVKYIGDSESGTVTVTSGDIIFNDGDVGSEGNGAGTDSNGVGNATAGRIDISNAAEDTIAEALPLINQATGWIAVAVDAVGSDAIGTSAELLTLTATQAKTAKGVQILWDTSAKMNDTVLVAPAPFRDDIRVYQQGQVVDSGTVDNMKPFEGTAAVVKGFTAVSTYGSGTSTLQIIEDTDPTSATGSAVVYSVAGGATTVAAEKNFTLNPFEGKRSARVLVRISNSSAQSVVGLQVSGEFIRKLN